MSFRLEPGEALAANLRRALVEELDVANRMLRDVDPTAVDSSVHEARKCLKRARTVQRLLREVLDERYGAANARLRDAGRALSGTRDAAVLVETLDGLLAGPELGGAAFATLRERLECERAQAVRIALGDAGPREAAREGIAAARAEAAAWVLDGEDERVLAGVRRVYRRGRRRMRDAEREQSAEALHEWRKRVKDLGYTLQLFTPCWPEVLGPLADEARRMWNLLGDDHDLHLFAAALEERAPAALTPAQLQTLADVVISRRTALQRAAFTLGARLYADKPAAFTRRVRICLSAG